MKHCTYCGQEYSDDVEVCSIDGMRVERVGEAETPKVLPPDDQRRNEIPASALSMSEDLNPNPDVDQENEELCVNYLTGNRAGSNFCRKCGAPLSSYAATGPFEALFAEGHVYRKATERPQRLIVVLGIWVLFGLMAFLGFGVATLSRKHQFFWGFLVGVGLMAISLFLIGKTTMNYCKRKETKNEKSEDNGGPG